MAGLASLFCWILVFLPSGVFFVGLAPPPALPPSSRNHRRESHAVAVPRPLRRKAAAEEWSRPLKEAAESIVTQRPHKLPAIVCESQRRAQVVGSDEQQVVAAGYAEERAAA